MTESPGLSLRHVDVTVAERAAHIRANYNLGMSDALVAGTAVAEGCSHLISNGAAFHKVPELRALIVQDFVS